jgi:two-component system sensor histidine kinase UhpB
MSALRALSLRLRLILLIVLLLLLSLGLGGAVACLNATRSVQTEMTSAFRVARQSVETGLEELARSSQPAADLDRLIATFDGNRHVRVSFDDGRGTSAVPAEGAVLAGGPPSWFADLIAVPPLVTQLPVMWGGERQGVMTIETVPRNEILEIWDEFGDSLLIVALFSLPTVLLIYVVVGHTLRPLDRMGAALETIGHGRYDVRVEGDLPPELAGLRDSFNRMAGQLAAISRENRRLNHELLSLQEQERGDVARDLHDEVGPLLFAIKIDAAAIERQASARHAAIARQAASITEAAGHLQAQVKAMLGRLRPIGLAEFGLAQAIDNLVEFWRRRRPDIAFAVDIACDKEGFGDIVDTTIFRIVQEALSNALRHGRPDTITVVLRDLGDITVTVSDDGQGMPASRGPGFGLIGMSERVRALGGRLDIANRSESGFAVVAVLPRPERPSAGRAREIAS